MAKFGFSTSLLIVSATLISGCGPQEEAVPESVAQVDPVSTVFTIAEPDLLPENVAFDPTTGSYFVGSTRKGKILRIQGGVVTDFKGPRADGLWMVIGMKVDAERRSLWVCSSEGGNLENAAPSDGRSAGLFRFDLDTGELLDQWLLVEPGVEHFLNDLVVAPDGRVYVTHMFEEGAIWLAEPDGAFEPFVALPEGAFPNGLAFSAAGTSLYVASSLGLLSIDLAEGAVRTLASPDASLTRGIDGLYATRGGLVGIRPDAGAVWLYELDAAGEAVINASVLLADHPDFFGPTTGVLVGDALHFIANAQFDRVGEGGALPPLSEMADPVVLSLQLPGGAGR